MIPTGAVTNELDNATVLEGQIPSVVLEIAAAQNIKGEDIWGVYLAPDDPRNPNSGIHYLGMRTVSSAEFIKQVGNETHALATVESQNEWIESLQTLTALPEKIIEVVKNEGLEAIKAHELTHKVQWDNYNYQSDIVAAFEKMSKVSPDKRSAILANYQDLILLAEVQALSVQCSRETKNPEEQRLFNTYWFSKTFRLLNERDTQKYIPSNISMDEQGNIKVDYGSREIEQLKSLYNSLRNHSDYSRNVSNVNGLLSRALFVCENPAETLNDIREGNIEYAEFRERVIEGLNTFIKCSSKDFARRASRLNKNLETFVKDAAGKLRISLE